jgi:hypothetical protein
MADFKKDGIEISISREHSEVETDVREFFEGLEAYVAADLVRKSDGNLPMQIMIFLGGVVVSGMTWDLIKLGVSRLFKKYPKAHIVIRDQAGIMYAIKHDGKVGVVVAPDRANEFSHIRHIHGLGKHLVEETEEDRLEYRRRFDLVLAIVLAATLGLILNVFANIYYDAFLVKTTNLNSYDPLNVATLSGFFLVVAAFLQFLVYDYKNKLQMEKGFWKRYVTFLTEDFVLSRIAQRVQRVIVFFLFSYIGAVIFLVIAGLLGLIVFVGVLILSFIIMATRDRIKVKKL